MANLVDELLKKKTEDFTALRTGVYKSTRLAEILGKDEPVEVKIREIPQRKYKDIQSRMVTKQGDYAPQKIYETQLQLIIEGVVDPDLHDQELQKHFGAGDPKTLAEIIFGRESTDLSGAIVDLCEYNEAEEEDEIKN